ncbi:hypothetical protein HK100_004918 [Physocladia obscura]|uniref:TauD/TfdA-like domain-containing protein n=1 Tax=Physocladia obscura TaxID=109957 RepID=A0AAD5ST87_9FUNG|nr:hypothetical protein HK100_004918 [Physocladia obscura]
MPPIENLSKSELSALKKRPLRRNFSLDTRYRNFKVEPHLGTEYENGIQIRDILNASNREELLLEFAVLVSERNVFLRSQNATFDKIAEFANAFGRASGKSATSGLHIHPTAEKTSEFGQLTHVISSEKSKTYVGIYNTNSELHSETWHSDVTFEPIPSDYAILKIRKSPPEGGDTLWASAYEVTDRNSCRPVLLNLTKAGIAKINTEHRGAPENFGQELTTVHPVIRTNPVTRWKGVFVNNVFTKRINELSKDESDFVLRHLFNLTSQNHDFYVSFQWNDNDVAVWDNRSSFHTATADFNADLYVRFGERITSLGEKSYLDPNLQSRREALGILPPVARRTHLAA